MINTDHDQNRQITLNDITTLLGHQQWTSLMFSTPNQPGVINHHVTPQLALILAAAATDQNVWYGVNEIDMPPGGNRRATEHNIAHWCAIWADLDIKEGGCPNQEIAHQIIDTLTQTYGQPPTYIVTSGHGLQPVWAITHTDPDRHLTTPDKRAQAVALLRRHGRLVQATAIQHGAKADSVFDLSRVLRAPDTTNWKQPDQPQPTSAWHGGGQPLTITEIRDALNQAGVTEMPSDTPLPTTIVAPPSTWTYRTSADRCRYADTMITEWAGDHPPARHPWLVAQAVRIAAAARHGCLTTTDTNSAERALSARFIALCQRPGDPRHIPRAEINDALRYGRNLVATMTGERVARELGNHTHNVTSSPDNAMLLAAIADNLNTLATTPATAAAAAADPTTEDDPQHLQHLQHPQHLQPIPATVAPINPQTIYTDTIETIEQTHQFWDARQSLHHIWNAALAAEASPWAVLAVTLLRTITAIPPTVYLPPLGAHGPKGSLNLFAGITGDSGAGKGIAAGVANLLYRHPAIYQAPPGSGEGIGHLYGGMAKDPETKHTEFHWTRHAVLIDAPEVDSLGAIGGRRGSTADAILRQAFSGETLGFSYAAAEKRLHIPAGQYRLTMMVGVQPERATTLFTGAGGGTPQRFLWAPAEDHRIGKIAATWDGTPLDPYKPEWWPDHHTIDVTPTAMDEIRDDRRRRGQTISLIPTDTIDETAKLDAHALYVREKVAAALAVLDGRQHVTDDDWALSGAVMAVSTLVRDGILNVIEHARLRDAERRGAERGAEQVGARATAVDIDTRRATETAHRILTVVQEAGDATYRDIAHRVSKPQRPHLGAAIAGLIETGQIVAVEVAPTRQGGRPGMVYRLP